MGEGDEEGVKKGAVCVTGGSGYVASWLIFKLLQQGYLVRTTIRTHQEEMREVSYLTNLPGASTRLKIYNADLNQPESFKEAIEGCIGVFHVAHPMDVHGQEAEEVVTKRSVQGLLGILRTSLNSKTVKRVVYTSSTAAVMINSDFQTTVMDENTWSDLDCCRNFSKPVGSSYFVSKTVTEKTALEFAEEHGFDVVTLVLPLVVGPFICPNLPFSVYMALNLIFGKEDSYKYVSKHCVVHIDDVANAHIFLLQLQGAKGRYICPYAKVNVEDIYNFLSEKYPQFQLPSEDQLKEKMVKYSGGVLSSKKLLDSGFESQYGIDEMFDQAIQCCKEKGFL